MEMMTVDESGRKGYKKGHITTDTIRKNYGLKDLGDEAHRVQGHGSEGQRG